MLFSGWFGFVSCWYMGHPGARRSVGRKKPIEQWVLVDLSKKKKNSEWDFFYQTVLSCTDVSLDVILLPGIFILFIITRLVDVTSFFCLSSGVAFDRSLSRLGHGKGYYDRFISSYIASGRNKPLLGMFIWPYITVTSFWIYINFWEIVGLSLREQLQSTAVPIDESDWKLDMLVTPDEVIGGL